ncbi:uncharacterized protein I206_100788 [Kwoniella pini CBS 10737]|uniref:RNase III domain-containing protein n=1 Tax=Kwoniella pini CBS 10737 TaxID=1296096 RepID=A0A1B9IC53_9TREE|nr:uncharacterized protein I206_00539 [Kwoniella pini CBS 10737]OCF53238.1 hypothetical protein I206_00539 [Kwoniella pini CBS 10737]
MTRSTPLELRTASPSPEPSTSINTMWFPPLPHSQLHAPANTEEEDSDQSSSSRMNTYWASTYEMNHAQTSKPNSVNQPFQRPILPRPVKIESYTPRRGPVYPFSQTGNEIQEDTSMVKLNGRLPHSGGLVPSSLGKRKAESEIPEDMDNTSRPNDGHLTLSTSENGGSTSSSVDTKPNIPIPILPIPLPSKRFKKRPTAKALLIPVEQLPVFALPPMPPIEDPDLLKQVFTHQSLFERAKGQFEDPIDNPSKHYEKLEHVGDSILGMIVTTWLHESRPNLTIGTATRLKAHLVSNATLSHISGLYNLPQRLNGHPELLPVLRAQTDVRAALIEAYIAGLYFSFSIEKRLNKGLKKIDKWLREMYEPLYDFFYNYMKKEFEQHYLTIGSTLDGKVISLKNEEELKNLDKLTIGMSNLISMYCKNQKRELNWQEYKIQTNQGFLWKIKCQIDGIEISESIRSFRKSAKNVAAWEAAKKLGLTVSLTISVQDLAN